MYRMSSLSNKLSTFVSPSLNAASNKQRLLNDLDPGNVTVPSKLLIGVTVNVSVSVADIERVDVVALFVVVDFENVGETWTRVKAVVDVEEMVVKHTAIAATAAVGTEDGLNFMTRSLSEDLYATFRVYSLSNCLDRDRTQMSTCLVSVVAVC